MNVGLNCQSGSDKTWLTKFSFGAYEVCTNFGGGLLQRGRRTGVQALKLVIFHSMQRH